MSYPGQLYNVPTDPVYRDRSPSGQSAHSPYLTPSPHTPYPPDQRGYFPPQSPVTVHAINHRSAATTPYPNTPAVPQGTVYRSAPFYEPPAAPPRPPPSPQPVLVQQYGYQEPYQYSQCTGNRKALLIGINYFGTSNELKGCINDVRNLAPFLNQRYGFSWDDMVILTDDQQNPKCQPTRANILSAMNWLVAGAKPNDSLFLHFSGHGGQTEDLDGDEEDGLDETIYPVDFKRAGEIVDDDMHDILVKPLPRGCRLTAIFDCCHSGSLLDLPYEYGAKGLKEPSVIHDGAKGLLDAGMAYARGDINGLLSTGLSLFKRVTRTKEDRERTRINKTSPADVIQFSGCKDYQKSADTTEAGQATGAMSWAFREVLTRQPQQSYQSLLENVRELLAAKYSQKPLLSASHPIDTNLQFVL